MRELSLHILDIVQNSLAADADKIWVLVNEDIDNNLMEIIIKDNGRGMGQEELQKVLDPFYTTRKTRRVGLGLSLLQANAQACGGGLWIESEQGMGTTVRVVFVHDHIDRTPLGDMVSTLVTLVAGAPEVDFEYERRLDRERYVFKTVEIKEVLDGTPLNHPEVLAWLKGHLEEKEEAIISKKTIK